MATIQVEIHEKTDIELNFSEHIVDASDADGIAFVVNRIFPFTIEIEDKRSGKTWHILMSDLCVGIGNLTEEIKA